MVKESKMYPFVERYLLNRVGQTLSKGDEAESYNEVVMFYGYMKSIADIVVYKWECVGSEKNELPIRELTEMHICECKPFLYTYKAYGQLLHYKSILDLYFNGGHFLAYNEDFCDGVKSFWERNERFPVYWDKHLKTDSLERLSPKLKAYLYLALLYEKKHVDKDELDDTVAFHRRCLGNVMNGAMGLLTVYYPSERVFSKKKPKPIRVERLPGQKPKSFFDVDKACIVRKRVTWRYCPWFKDGKYWRCIHARRNKCIESACSGYRNY